MSIEPYKQARDNYKALMYNSYPGRGLVAGMNAEGDNLV